MLGNCLCFCCRLLTFFKQKKKKISETLSECQTFCRSSSGSKLFTKVISRRQKLPLARKDLKAYPRTGFPLTPLHLERTKFMELLRYWLKICYLCLKISSSNFLSFSFNSLSFFHFFHFSEAA